MGREGKGLKKWDRMIMTSERSALIYLQQMKIISQCIITISGNITLRWRRKIRKVMWRIPATQMLIAAGIVTVVTTIVIEAGGRGQGGRVSLIVE